MSSISGNTVTLERPLPLEIDTAWTPQVRAAAPSVVEVGIENLTIEFAGSTYPGHFKERGYNAIQLEGAFNSWAQLSSAEEFEECYHGAERPACQSVLAFSRSTGLHARQPQGVRIRGGQDRRPGGLRRALTSSSAPLA